MLQQPRNFVQVIGLLCDLRFKDNSDGAPGVDDAPGGEPREKEEGVVDAI
jgi:hypothetical protein